MSGLVQGLLVGALSGGTLAAVFQASHEDAQRRRDRLLDTADAFLTAAADATSRLGSFGRSGSQFIGVTQRLDEVTSNRLAQLVDETEDTEDDESSDDADNTEDVESSDDAEGSTALDAISEAMETLSDAESRFLTDESEAAGARLQDAADRLTQALSDLRSIDPTTHQHLHKTLSGWVNELIPAGQLMRREMASASAATESLSYVLPRILVYFSADSDSAVTQEASALVQGIVAWHAAIDRALDQSRAPDEDDDVRAAARASGEAVMRFAYAVNQRTSRPWWKVVGI